MIIKVKSCITLIHPGKLLYVLKNISFTYIFEVSIFHLLLSLNLATLCKGIIFF
uniref:Uncharacterized protein n=1 Tax=Arundo donax TaxID=35708 RepID=A0A0A8ZAF0_ARUDO